MPQLGEKRGETSVIGRGGSARVKIGNGCTVGAGSLAARLVSSGTTVFGAPATMSPTNSAANVLELYPAVSKVRILSFLITVLLPCEADRVCP